MINETILHYRIIEELGRGGMGVVYKAKDEKLRRHVAIKFLPREFVAKEDMRRRFKNEARAAAALNHTNIATIHAIEDDADPPFIVMEYITGHNLRDTLAARPLTFEQAVKIAMQIGAGIQAAHEKKVIHRDIKPANIMMTPAGHVKVTDFGLAKIERETMVTQIGETIGTAAYMSPEQILGNRVDHRADIWAYGIVLYELLTGARPFEGDNPNALMYRITNMEPDLPSSVRPALPVTFDRIIMRALKKTPDERYPNMTEMLDDLRTGRQKPSGQTRPLKVGDTVDSYQILEVLGEGGMGVVYKAKDQALERIVALKKMSTNRHGDGQFLLKRFFAEAKSQARLDHANIAKIYRLQEKRKPYYIVMEYIDGETLTDLLREKGKLSVGESVSVFKQILAAIEAAHETKVYHRDLKPENIMITRSGEVKVMDFGLAKIQKDRSTTMTIGIAGTLDYMAPEQKESLAQTDYLSDIYSLGVTFYEMLIGKTPSKYLATDQTGGVNSRVFKAPHRVTPRVPKGLSRIVMKAIQRERGDRFQSVKEFRRALLSFEKKYVLHKEELEARKRKRVFGYSIAASLLVLAAVVATLFFLMPKRANVVIVSDQTGAVIFLDGDSVGTTPASVALEIGQSCSLRLVKSGFLPEDTLFVVEEDEKEQTIFLPLQRAAQIAIQITPPDAGVQIDGGDFSRDQLAKLTLAEGEHRITVSRDGYAKLDSIFRLTGGDNPALSFSLKPTHTGSIFFVSNPPGAELFIDGSKIGVTPFDTTGLELNRKYNITIRLEGYRRYIRSKEWKTRESGEFKAELKKAPLKTAPAPTPRPTPVPKKTHPQVERLNKREAPGMLRQRDLFAIPLNRDGKGVRHDFAATQAEGESFVLDRETGLMWQAGVSSKRMDYYEAFEYVKELNDAAFGGHNDWNMPTLQEAASLLAPGLKDSGSFADQKFLSPEKAFWLLNIESKNTAWRISFINGAVGYDNKIFQKHFVKLVRKNR